MMKILEKDVQRAVLDWLAYNRIFHWRSNTMGVPKIQNGMVIGFRPSQVRGGCRIS